MERQCIVTGANGFVGSRLRFHLERAGWKVIGWTRHPKPGGVAFRLGENVSSRQLEGVEAVVHCAYDFKARGWHEIQAVNVNGSRKFLQAARDAGVKKLVFISSISAFPGCRSLYGKAKMEIEALAQSLGAFILRPGLVYGDGPGGVFGRLVQQVRNSGRIPLLTGGAQTQYLVHEEDLGRVVLGCVEGQIPLTIEPLTIANEHGLELKEIMTQIAAALGKRISFLPIPWQAVWLGLKTGELCHIPLDFRSDSLISMVYQNPNPSFLHLNGIDLRPFQVTKAMLG